jgi:cell division protein FtsL
MHVMPLHLPSSMFPFALDVEILMLMIFVGHVAMIKSLNEHVAKLEAKITEHELENEKYKFVRSILFNERHPRIKDVVGFQTGEKENTKVKVNGQEFLKFVKGKAPIVHHDHAHVSHVHTTRAKNVHAKNASHAHVSYAKASHVRHNDSHAKIAHVLKIKIKNASNGPYMSYHTFDASYVLTHKFGKVVAKFVGPRHKNAQSYVWGP